MIFRAITFSIVFLCLPLATFAANKTQVERQFQTWQQSDLWPQAKAAGVSRRTFKSAFSGVTLNWDLPDLVPPGSARRVPKVQRQAEFGSPGKYFSRGGVNGATRIGRQMAKQHAARLRAVERATGVPGAIVLAIWGRESGYGRAKIPHDVFQVLGTKAFMSTRKAYFTKELIAALQIVQSGQIARKDMKSSWAGAMGQPQFMPSSFLKYATDGDGDGKADIWGSEADTLMSIGRYLADHGWQAGRDWGFEVTVPPSVSCTLEGPDQGRSIAQWESLGIRRVSGRPFPDHERKGEGFLLMPAGRQGPAFVVTPNFFVLKDYNKSDLYALFVGHVGDRIAYGVGDFTAPWRTGKGAIAGLYRSDIADMQRALENMGHDVGGADGLVGFKTRRSIGRWQEQQGEPASCFPKASMKSRLSR